MDVSDQLRWLHQLNILKSLPSNDSMFANQLLIIFSSQEDWFIGSKMPGHECSYISDNGLINWRSVCMCVYIAVESLSRSDHCKNLEYFFSDSSSWLSSLVHLVVEIKHSIGVRLQKQVLIYYTHLQKKPN